MVSAPAPAAGKDRLILALDVPTASEALAWSRRLAAEVGMVKVGLELFVAAGPSLVRQLAGEGRGVFLDLKLHDIPNTVAGAVRSATGLGARMLTLHAAGGPAMLAAAAAAAAATEQPPLLLGVTVLTSLDDSALAALGIGGPVPERVVAWARLCREAGLDGIVCAAAEAAAVRAACGPGFVIVTPGIRAAGAAKDDQARIATAAAARRAGADFLVVGRAITAAADPEARARQLAAEAQ
ncbi:MAG: orotidine-5'-phosphate decarboxylase [Terriglobales bacterium]